MTKKALRLPLGVLFLSILFYSFVLTPLTQHILSDAALFSTLWPDFMDLISHHAEIVANILVLEFIVFIVYRFPLQKAKRALLSTFSLILFKYLAAILTVSIAFGSLDLTGELTPYLFSLFLELAIAGFILFLAVRLISPVKSAFARRAAAAKILDQKFEEKDPFFPFQGFFQRHNPVLTATLVAITTVFLFQSISFAIFFISGAPMQPSDIPVMLIYEVLFVLLPSLYSYFIARLFFKLCVKSVTAAKVKKSVLNAPLAEAIVEQKSDITLEMKSDTFER